MQTFNVHDAKTNFSRLVDAAANGEEIIIARAGVPTARLVPLERQKKQIRFGALKNRIRISEDFDAALPEAVIRGFEGN